MPLLLRPRLPVHNLGRLPRLPVLLCHIQCRMPYVLQNQRILSSPKWFAEHNLAHTEPTCAARAGSYQKERLKAMMKDKFPIIFRGKECDFVPGARAGLLPWDDIGDFFEVELPC